MAVSALKVRGMTVTALEAESTYSLALPRKCVNLWTREEWGEWGHILEGVDWDMF